jgi:hypothetical protein
MSKGRELSYTTGTLYDMFAKGYDLLINIEKMDYL